MTLIVIHGPPASGKLTIAQELSRRINFRLFHNHLAVDLLLAVFEFGSRSFSKLREEIWLSVIREAARIGIGGLIFTFTPETSVSPGFLKDLVTQVESIGGCVRFVELTCTESEIENRLGSASRKGFGKLQSVELYRKLRAQGTFTISALPMSDLTIDTTLQSAQESADSIVAMLNR